jgi:hypothetical protein
MKTSCMPQRIHSSLSTSNPMADPPRLLVIGSDRAGNMVELIVLDLADERLLVIHAMPLRHQFYELLPGESDG